MTEYPLPGYRFVVTLYSGDTYLPPEQADSVPLVTQGFFREVSGLGGELEVKDYAEGGANDFVHKLPVRHSWSQISLRTGVVRDLGLWEWYRAGLTMSLGARRDGAILLMSPQGVAQVGWVFRGGLAAKYTGPELNAEQGAIAIEGLDIAHEGLTRYPL